MSERADLSTGYMALDKIHTVVKEAVFIADASQFPSLITWMSSWRQHINIFNSTLQLLLN
jgi:hypothetical protein